MKYNLSKIAMATVLALATSAGIAANSANVTGAYVGAGVGYGGINVGSGTYEGVNINTKQGGFAGRVNGGYLFALDDDVAVGADLAYTMYPGSKLTVQVPGAVTDKFSASSIDLSAVAKYFISDFSVLGRAGISAAMQKESAAGFPNRSATTYHPLLGVGVGYAIPGVPGLTATADFQYIFGTTAVSDIKRNDNSKIAQLNNPLYAVLVGVTYNFGAM
jgi:opacity protein-like surface antigen